MWLWICVFVWVSHQKNEMDQFKGQPRLPKFAVPKRYDIRLKPDLVACRFAGSVAVTVDIVAATSFIVLNAAELSVSNGAVSFTNRESSKVLSFLHSCWSTLDPYLFWRFFFLQHSRFLAMWLLHAFNNACSKTSPSSVGKRIPDSQLCSYCIHLRQPNWCFFRLSSPFSLDYLRFQPIKTFRVNQIALI